MAKTTIAAKGRKARQGGGAPTVADVARLANVSAMTVSRVVNGAANVHEDKRRDVIKAIEALGYMPNRAARSLAGAQQVRIALLYDNPSAAYLSELLLGAVDAATGSDAELVVEHVAGTAAEEVTEKLVRQRIDAVLLPPPLSEQSMLVKMLAERGLSLLQLATVNVHPAAQSIIIDDVAAAKAMTERLIAMGHRRIAFIAGDPNQSASGLRKQGYEIALEEAGVAFRSDYVVVGDYTYRSGFNAAERLLGLAERPSAIFASNDDMAAAVIAVANRDKITVPDQLSVCGYDDTSMATTIWPELTTIRQPVAEMAAKAIELLVMAVREPAATAKHLTLGHELIVRQSDSSV